MRVEHNRRRNRFGVAGIALVALTLATVPAAANDNREDRFFSEHPIHRAEVENLQRWVSAGHADWCKDERLWPKGNCRDWLRMMRDTASC